MSHDRETIRKMLDACAEGDKFILVNVRERHLNKAGEPKNYIRVECDASQREAFMELRESLIEMSGGRTTEAFDRILRAMGREVSEGLDR